MKNTLIIVSILALCACQQERQKLANTAVCDTIKQEVVDTQKEAAAQIVALLRNMETRLQSAEDFPEGTRLIYGNQIYFQGRDFIRLKHDTRQTLLVSYLDANGCSVPNEVPNIAVYVIAAKQCHRATSAQAESKEQLCDRDNWKATPADKEITVFDAFDMQEDPIP